MVGIVIVSHSEKLAEGVKEVAAQMASEVNIEVAGGTVDGRTRNRYWKDKVCHKKYL